MKIIALIPARIGSKRIPGKNTKLLGGKPLIQWTIDAAQQSGIFSDIIVATDAPMLADGVSHYRRLPSADDEPDIAWVQTLLAERDEDAFAILRPTSPFRDAPVIRAAWARFSAEDCDSLRAVRRVTEHPAKMWDISRGLMRPVLFVVGDRAPWHSMPTQSLPVYYVQTAGLEIAWTKTVRDYHSISGNLVAPFILEGWPAFDINTPEDWARAEAHVAASVPVARVSGTPPAQ